MGTFTITLPEAMNIPRTVKVGGNVATYFCTPDLRVVHAIAGNVDAATYLDEARWASELAKRIEGAAVEKSAALCRSAHEERAREIAAIMRDTLVRQPFHDGSEDKTPRGYRRRINWSNANTIEPVNVLGPGVHTKLSEAGLPALEAVQSHVFETLLRERLSDEPVRITGSFDLEKLQIRN